MRGKAFPRNRPALLRSAAGALSKDRGIRFAYAYGSFLRRRDARDLDIAVFLRPSRDPWGRSQRLADLLENALGRALPVDVHLLNEAAPAFAFRVIEDGRLLFERSRAERLAWEAHLLSRYQDLKPMLDFHDRKFLSQ